MEDLDQVLNNKSLIPLRKLRALDYNQQREYIERKIATVYGKKMYIKCLECAINVLYNINESISDDELNILTKKIK